MALNYTLSRKKKEKCINLMIGHLKLDLGHVSMEDGTRSFWRLNRFLIHALELKLRHFEFFQHLKPYSGPWNFVVCWLRSMTLMLRTLDRVPAGKFLFLLFSDSLTLINWLVGAKWPRNAYPHRRPFTEHCRYYYCRHTMHVCTSHYVGYPDHFFSA